MNTSGSRWFAPGRTILSLLALSLVALFMACGSADKIAGLRSNDAPRMDGAASPPPNPATGVVISQVYGGGGNSGAQFKNDFIELYNAGTTTVDLSTWSVQYAASGGTSWTNKTNLTGTIAPGHYYLIQEAVGAGTTLPALPTPDVIGTIAMGAGAGKVALVNSTAFLTGTGCPFAASVVDFVGYGTGTNCSETAVTPSLSNTTAALRTYDGQQDSNNNSVDFVVVAPNPRNSSSTGVTPVTPLTASLAPLTPSIEPGATQTFTASANKGATIVTVTSADWTSNNPAVATIDPASGVATAVAPGSTTIGVTVHTDQGTATASTVLTVTAPATPSAVVISQVYGGGGNNGSTLKNDFIELYNGGTTDVDLTGWSVQYGSAGANNWSDANKTVLSGVIPAGHYFLIKEGAGTGGTVDLTGFDLEGTIAIGGTSGTIALVRSGATLAGTCPKALPVIVDFVGYGSTTCFKGSGPTGVLSASTAALRRDYGQVNTNDNAADFDVGDPNPRGSSVASPPFADAASVTVSPASWSLRIGQTRAFTATARDAGGQLVSNHITWSSSNDAIVSIDSHGLATAKAVGTVTISATSSNGVVGTASVTVVVGNVTVQARAAGLPVGFQTQLFLNNGSTDSHGAPVGNHDVTWVSSSPSVVSVNATTGVITARALGSAVLTATSSTDGVSAGSTTITTVDPVIAPSARTGHNTELGVPTDADPSDDILLVRRQYTTSYNPRRGVTNWVSWNLDASHKGSFARCDCMTADTGLVRLGLPAYDTNDWVNDGTNGAYSRGHMSPSADWNISNGDNAVTFMLTNMLPQNQPMNAGPWGAFEDYLRTQATGTTEIYIVSGGIFTKNRRGPGVDGFGTISNAGKIAIPDSIWKVAVIVPDGRAGTSIEPADVRVIAINTPNEAPAGSASDYTPYYTTIARIEASTGYDLLSALPEAVQCRLETRNCPPVARLGGSGLAGGTEGQTLTFDASGSSDVEDGSALHYQWSVNGVDVAGPAGTAATLNYGFTDNGAYAVKVVVTDNGGASASASATVTVANVAPAVAAFNGATILQGETYSAAGSFSDPGADIWNAAVDYGDGSGSSSLALSGQSFSLSHVFATAGIRTVTVTVSDDDGGTGTSTAQVTVLTPASGIAALASTVSGLASSGGMDAGDASWVSNKLEIASSELAKGNVLPTRNQLEQIRDRIDAALRAGRISSADAASLTSYVNRLLAAIA